MTTLLLALVIAQGSPDYAAREQATATLKSLNVSGRVLLWASQHKDPEIAARSKLLHRVWCWETAQTLRPVDYPFTPWVDSLPPGHEFRGQIISAYLCAAGPARSDLDKPPSWDRYRRATKLFLFYFLLEGNSETDALALLEEMRRCETEWIQRHKDKWKFPAELLAAAE